MRASLRADGLGARRYRSARVRSARPARQTRAPQPLLVIQAEHPRRSILSCRRPVFLDVGDGWLLYLRFIGNRAPHGGWGSLVSAGEFVNAALERAEANVMDDARDTELRTAS